MGHFWGLCQKAMKFSSKLSMDVMSVKVAARKTHTCPHAHTRTHKHTHITHTHNAKLKKVVCLHDSFITMHINTKVSLHTLKQNKLNFKKNTNLSSS
jgi:hypothetical protein